MCSPCCRCACLLSWPTNVKRFRTSPRTRFGIQHIFYQWQESREKISPKAQTRLDVPQHSCWIVKDPLTPACCSDSTALESYSFYSSSLERHLFRTCTSSKLDGLFQPSIQESYFHSNVCLCAWKCKKLLVKYHHIIVAEGCCRLYLQKDFKGNVNLP